MKFLFLLLCLLLLNGCVYGGGVVIGGDYTD